MSEAEAIDIVVRAIDYVDLMRESSGEDNGERELARDLADLLGWLLAGNDGHER